MDIDTLKEKEEALALAISNKKDQKKLFMQNKTSKHFHV